MIAVLRDEKLLSALPLHLLVDALFTALKTKVTLDPNGSPGGPGGMQQQHQGGGLGLFAMGGNNAINNSMGNSMGMGNGASTGMTYKTFDKESERLISETGSVLRSL